MDKEQTANKNQSEVTYKIKCAIKKKLLELIDFNDEELPEYIMILIANKKSKVQIENDLQLFLGEKTSDFTKWLLDLLSTFKNAESVKSNNDTSCPEKNEPEPDEDALLLLDCDPDDKAGDLFSHEDTNDSVLSKSSNPAKFNVVNKICDLKSNNEKVSTFKKVKEKNKLVENSKNMMHTSRNQLPSAVVSVRKEMVNALEYDPTKPNYASSKHNPRRFSVPERLQINKLLSKAVDDATKSILKGKSVTEFYKPTPIKVLTSAQSSRNIYRNSTPLLADDTQLENTVMPSNNAILTFDEEIYPVTPHFTVTLDGISVNSFKRKFAEISLDSFEDEEPSDKKQEVNERCKFWPACKNRDHCVYHHPTIACKCFPDCKYGDKCLFIHPNCKFDALCSRKDCFFTHASKRKLAWVYSVPVKMKPVKKFKIKTVCKFYPNCTSRSCIYLHPRMCRYGVECRAPNCLYGHYSVPSRNQMKWQARYF